MDKTFTNFSAEGCAGYNRACSSFKLSNVEVQCTPALFNAYLAVHKSYQDSNKCRQVVFNLFAFNGSVIRDFVTLGPPALRSSSPAMSKMRSLNQNARVPAAVMIEHARATRKHLSVWQQPGSGLLGHDDRTMLARTLAIGADTVGKCLS